MVMTFYVVDDSIKAASGILFMNQQKTIDNSYRLGIDLGGTKIEIAVLDKQNTVVFRKRVATPSDDYDAILALLTNLVTEADATVGERLTVGIGTPGAISPRSGLLRNSNTVCMNGRAFKDDFEKLLQRSVNIQNDANCFTLSEAIHGAGQNHAVVFGVIIGTGTGAGLVVNGQLINGPHSITGEWGHNPLPWHTELDGNTFCYCGKQACIETFLSGQGLAASFLRGYGFSLSSEQVVAKARLGDSQCLAAMAQYFDQMARALAHVINMVDPDVIVLGGGMSNISEIYQQVPSRLVNYVFSDYVETPLLRATHGDASGALGAALLSGD
ncbi:MAG: fructokinase [Urechidicola sp.]|jgi:fructokinase